VKATSVLMFDLCGVLVAISAFDSLASMLDEKLDRDALKDRWLRSPVVRALELGQISPEEFAARFVAEWPVSRTPETFLAEFASWVRGPYPGAVELLARLRRKHHVSCLSNSNPVH
jgi:glucose-1-phosphatase